VRRRFDSAGVQPPSLTVTANLRQLCGIILRKLTATVRRPARGSILIARWDKLMRARIASAFPRIPGNAKPHTAWFLVRDDGLV